MRAMRRAGATPTLFTIRDELRRRGLMLSHHGRQHPRPAGGESGGRIHLKEREHARTLEERVRSDRLGRQHNRRPGQPSPRRTASPTWVQADAAAAFAALQEGGTLDTEWRYHILVVPLMAQGDTDFGFMYVRGDQRARTDLFMASHFIFPDTEPHWGSAARPEKRQDGLCSSAPPCTRWSMRGASITMRRASVFNAADGGDRAGGDCRRAVPVKHHLVVRSGGRAPASSFARHLGASGGIDTGSPPDGMV